MPNERLKLVAYCPLCGARRVKVDTRVLGGDDDAKLIHVTCRRCLAQMLTLTLVTPGSSGAVGLVTDLSADDALRFAEVSTISADHLLNIHEWLEGSALALNLSPSLPKESNRPQRRQNSHPIKRHRTVKAARHGRSH